MGDSERLVRIEEDVTNSRIDIGVIRENLNNHQQVLDKLDKNLEKLQEVVVTMSTVIKLHEADMNYREERGKDSYKDFHQKLDKQNQDLSELTKKFSAFELRVLGEISKLKVVPKSDRGVKFKWHYLIIIVVVAGLVLTSKSAHGFFSSVFTDLLSGII